MKAISYSFLALVYAYVLAPAVVVIYGSFNSATSFPSPFESATLKWYAEILQHQEFIDSARVSAVVAVVAAGLATLVATPSALTLVRRHVRGKEALSALFLTPLVVPQIIIGLAMLQLLSLFAIQLGLAWLIVIHAVFVMPFVLRSLMTSLVRFDISLEEAAASLGANRWRTFWHVTLPNIRNGMTAGFTFALIISFVNLPLSLFLTTPKTTTLPIQMFAYMESRIDPLIAAVGSAIIIFAFAASFFLERVLKLRLLA